MGVAGLLVERRGHFAHDKAGFDQEGQFRLGAKIGAARGIHHGNE
jgi:hypothetical protein